MTTTRHSIFTLTLGLSFSLACWIFFGVLIGLVCGPTPDAEAAQGNTELYAGSLDSQQLTWQRNADGSYQVRIPATSLLEETDKPVLALQRLHLLVPRDANIVDVEVIPQSTHIVSAPGRFQLGDRLMTDDGTQVVVDRLPVGDAIFPTQWGEFAGSHFYRGFRIIAVNIYPLRALQDANGNWTSVEVMDSFTVRGITDSDPDIPEVADRERLIPGERQRVEAALRRMVNNPEVLGGYNRPDGNEVAAPSGGFQPSRTPTLTGSAVSYLIVTSTELAPVFQILADHKIDEGLPAVVATLDWITANYRNGADIQETVRMFIRDAYQKWGVEYVLLGGDTDILPARFAHNTYYPSQGHTDIPADLYFACLDGNWNDNGNHLFGEVWSTVEENGDEIDMADEVFVGRAPVSNVPDAAVFVNKTISYTRVASGSDWTNRALWAAEVLFPQGWEPGETITLDGANFAQGIIDDFATPCTDMENIRMYQNYYDFPGSVDETREAFIDSVNTGHYGIVDQIGHGFFVNMSMANGNFTNADADALVNGDHWFMLYALNCASAAFDHSCLMERFLQNPAGGSVVSIGSCRAAFPYTANNYQETFFEPLYCGTAFRAGELISLSRAPYYASTYYNTVHRWTYMVYTLLGDPAVGIWTGEPEEVQITAPSSLVAGQQVLNITVETGGMPVEGARVCVNKDGEDYVYGITSSSGLVNLTFTPISGGNATLTVTGKDLAFTQMSLPVITGSSFIAVVDHQVVDDGSYNSSGNGNGVAEAGETLALFIQCQDTGGGGATNCTGFLTTGTPGVTLVEGNALIGDVPPGGTTMSQDPFLLTLDPSMIDGTVLDLDYFILDSNMDDYTSTASLTALAPEPESIELVWSDEEFGNGNGIINNSERITVTVTLKNFGAGLADEVTGVLRTFSHQVARYDSVVTYSDIALMESSSGSSYFSFSDFDASTIETSWILFEDNHGRTFRHEFQLQNPVNPGTVNSDTPEGPDIITLSWEPIEDDELRGYHIYRSIAEGGPFDRVNTDLVESSSYFRDAGLAPLTRYYYYVTAVDSSLIESAGSTVVSQSTAPAELAGFPLPFSLETSGHLAVGDVTADGHLEIVLGSDEVYVLRDDGSELFDGDDNPQTHGPITKLDGEFQPAGITLANLDNRPGLEIIASRRLSDTSRNYIHVFHDDGTELEGWPQELKQFDGRWNWATPAVGDVDGDTNPDVVVNTLDGCTWVWHDDGTELLDGDNNPNTNGVFICREEGAGEWTVSSPALFDLDGDGADEIIFGTKYGAQSDNYLLAFKHDQSQAAGFPYNVGTGNILCSPAIADLNDDGIYEIVFHSQNDLLHVVQQDGTPYDGFPISFTSNPGAMPLSPSPALANMDGDDDLEIIAVSTHNSTTAYLYVIDTDITGGTSGDTLPGWPQLIPGSTEASPVVGDIDGDTVPDILHGIGGSSEESPNRMFGFKADGQYVDGFPITLVGAARACPTICDLDQDGDTDIVFGSRGLLIHVWDMPFAYDEEYVRWPTFQANVERTGVYFIQGPSDVPEPVDGDAMILAPPYPNPFNPATTVKLYLPGTAGNQRQLQVSVYDVRGHRVRVLHDGPATPGWHTWIWDGKDGSGRTQASGMYFLRARSDAFTAIQKLALIK